MLHKILFYGKLQNNDTIRFIDTEFEGSSSITVTFQ